MFDLDPNESLAIIEEKIKESQDEIRNNLAVLERLQKERKAFERAKIKEVR